MENNEKKRFGRRASFGIAALVLITIEHYVAIFKSLGIEWPTNYAMYVAGIVAFIIGGLSATDIWGKK